MKYMSNVNLNLCLNFRSFYAGIILCTGKVLMRLNKVLHCNMNEKIYYKREKMRLKKLFITTY